MLLVSQRSQQTYKIEKLRTLSLNGKECYLAENNKTKITYFMKKINVEFIDIEQYIQKLNKLIQNSFPFCCQIVDYILQDQDLYVIEYQFQNGDLLSYLLKVPQLIQDIEKFHTLKDYVQFLKTNPKSNEAFLRHNHISSYLTNVTSYKNINARKIDQIIKQKWMRKLLQTLAMLNSQHIPHHNIKMSNLLISNDFEFLILTDFAYRPVSTHKLIYNQFAAPETLTEQCQFHEFTDVWSAGCVCYQIMSGRTAFYGDNVAELQKNILNCGFEMLHQDEAQTYPELAALLPKMIIGSGRLKIGEVIEGLVKSTTINVTVGCSKYYIDMQPLDNMKTLKNKALNRADFIQSFHYQADQFLLVSQQKSIIDDEMTLNQLILNQDMSFYKVECIMLIDASSSMVSCQNDIIAGYNQCIDQLRRLRSQTYVTLIIFSDDVDILYQSKNVMEVEYLSQNDYTPNGGKALNDAIYYAITQLTKSFQNRHISEQPNVVSFFIASDGEEKDSKRITNKLEIKQLIEEKKQMRWNFDMISSSKIGNEEAKQYYGLDSQFSSTSNALLSDGQIENRTVRLIKQHIRKYCDEMLNLTLINANIFKNCMQLLPVEHRMTENAILQMQAVACPLCLRVMSDPVTYSDKQTYCKTCIDRWLIQNNNLSPFNFNPATAANLDQQVESHLKAYKNTFGDTKSDKDMGVTQADARPERTDERGVNDERGQYGMNEYCMDGE